MFSKWSKGQVGKTILCTVLCFALYFATMFIGFINPFCWGICFPVLAAFLISGPITYLAYMKPGIGSIAVGPIFTFLVMFVLGEFSQGAVIIGFIGAIILAEILRAVLGYKTEKGLRVSMSVLSILGLVAVINMWLKTAWYSKAALNEMSTEYSNQITDIGNNYFLLALSVILCVIMANISISLTKKIFKLEW